MRRRTMLGAALWAVTAAATGADGGRFMNVHASLSVDAGHDKVLVTIRIENRGERRVGLPREIAADTELSRRVFDLRRHPGGAELPYTGRMVKRAALTLDDYIELPPHSARTHTIDITRAYAFEPGTQDYVIRYQGAVLADAHQLESAAELSTGPVTFSHTGR